MFNITSFLLQELNKQQTQLEYEHTMLIGHHESTQDLEYKQITAVQKMKDEHLKKQHQTEKENQKEYNAKEEQQLRKKHALEHKQQPRSLKVGIHTHNMKYFIQGYFHPMLSLTLLHFLHLVWPCSELAQTQCIKGEIHVI